MGVPSGTKSPEMGLWNRYAEVAARPGWDDGPVDYDWAVASLMQTRVEHRLG